ncbi:unnamed protein product [Mytilus coruscus]|uniref:Uncharacterized protein n=1 Tax=Mytilus coruscus TaxID=42192 RepID=A0A6J8ETP7_MYTCO|nr:unnamed protein product [Mytilus coruscus]
MISDYITFSCNPRTTVSVYKNIMDFIHILLIFNVDFLSVMLATGYPDPPTDVRIHVNGSTAMVSWIIPTNQGITWSGISLKDSEKGDVVLNSTKKNTYEYIRIPISSFEIDNLKICSEYTVKIRFSSTTGYSKYTTQKFWMTSLIFTAEIGKDIDLSWTIIKADFFTVFDPSLKGIYTVSGGSIFSNTQSLKYKFNNASNDVTAINITVLHLNETDAGIYIAKEAGKVYGCCLLVVTANPTKPTLDVIPEQPFVNDNITFSCDSTVKQWPAGYRTSNLSYTFVGNHRGATEHNRLTIHTLTKSDKGINVSCQATDDLGKVSNMSNTVTLNPYYGPDKVDLTPEYTAKNVTEGTSLGPIICTASCNPECKFQWKLKTTGKFEDLHTNKNNLTVIDITRNQSGIYRCLVVHQYNEAIFSREDISVNVQYSPKIAAFWLTDNDEPYGSTNPKNYSFKEDVNLKVKLRIESNPNPQLGLNSSLLKFSPLNYTKKDKYYTSYLPILKCEVSGKYTIQAFNGIEYGDTKTVNFIICCKPRNASVESRTIGAKIGTVENIVMNVVSFPAPTIKFVFKTGFNLTIQRDRYDYRHKIYSTIHIKSKHDFGVYGIEVCNKVGCIVENITVKPEDKPEAPQNFSVGTTTFRSVNLSWIAGFDGGHNQTFTVQFKTTEDDRWKTKKVDTNEIRTGSTVYYTLDHLKPDTSYQVMVLSTNKHGKRNASLEFETKVEPTLSSPSSSAAVSPLSIGIGCGKSKECNVLYAEVDKEQQKSKWRKPVKEDSDELENAEYASVVKSKSKKVHYKDDAIETENNEYAVVDKSIKDYTENESVYANQDDGELLLHKPLEAQASGRSTNQDGLTYIEVSFTSNQSDRRPIIGAESKTDYVDIDFTRKADPLPDDSD